MGPVIELAEQDSPQENLPPVAETASERRVTLGGYVETEYWNDFHGNSYFDQHRMVLFVGARIHPRITFATEIEWEHGGTPRKRDGSFIAGESLLEYVVVDFRIAEWLQARAGIVLVPVGMLNIRHDAPRWDLTVRPDVSQTIIPTTWFETGAGLFGRIPIASQELTYELYAINGLDTKIYDETGLRAARGSLGEDNNDDKALTGRVGYRPFTAVEVGVSGYRGAYDPESTRFVRIGAVDFSGRFGPVEVLGEAALVGIDPGFDEGWPEATRKPVPEGMRGFWVQTSLDFMPALLRSVLPGELSESTFTATIRYNETNTNVDLVGTNDRSNLVLGLGYRPIGACVWKNEIALVDTAVDGALDRPFTDGWQPTPMYVTSVALMF